MSAIIDHPMRLNLHRRHSERCTGGHPAYSRSYEADELRRVQKKCYCPIYASGTLSGASRRRNTERFDWDEAKTVAAAWEQAGAWEVQIAMLPPVQPKTAYSDRFTIERATRAYLENRAGRNIQTPTLRKYRTLVNQLRAFAENKGYVMLDQLIATDMDAFYEAWKDGARSKGKKLERLQGFFKFCVKRKIIIENPAEDLRLPVGAGSAANKTPFTDAEIQRMYVSCRKLDRVEWKNGSHAGNWCGHDVETFILLECYTGLRISDASMFDIDRLKGNDCFLRMHKTDKPVFTWLPDEVVHRLLAMAKVHGSRPFLTLGGSTRMETAADLWRRKLNKVWELCGEWEEPPTPHRFRHTFVRVLLERGVSPYDVAELIGDTEQMVLKHYARWVPERQARHTRILQEAFSDPAKLVAISGGKGKK
jgi:integrase